MAAEAKNQLSVELGESSGMFARSALQAQHTDNRVYLLHAATALELLAKAVLAARHPSFIVPANDFESLLRASGEAIAPNRPRKRMKTISASQAVARAGYFAADVLPLVSELELLIDVRNGVAHLGEVQSEEDADRVFVPYLRASEALRETVGIDRGSYWGEFTDLVDSALKENVAKARVRVETALAIARTECARRFGSLDDATRQAILSVVEAGYRPEKYDEQLLDCPACDTPALVYGSVQIEYDEDWDHREGILINVHPIFNFTPQGMRCAAWP
jgi:hypothetical protein